jgi:hypothetical protein
MPSTDSENAAAIGLGMEELQRHFPAGAVVIKVPPSPGAKPARDPRTEEDTSAKKQRRRREKDREFIDHRRTELLAQFGRKRPLVSWAVLSLLCLGLAGAISGQRLFQAIWTDHTGITFCIAAVFVIAFVKSLLDALFIDREFRLTDKQIRLFWQSNIKDFLEQAEPSIFRSHVGNLTLIWKRDDLIMQDNLVELLHARLRAKIRPLDVASSIMVSLGLVGTIVGLIAAVGGLGSAMTSAGTDQTGLVAGMNATLVGMGTAFSATLMGSIFGGVILRLLYTSVNSQTEHLVAHIAELTEVHLLPVLRDAARERRAQANAILKTDVLTKPVDAPNFEGASEIRADLETLAASV